MEPDEVDHRGGHRHPVLRHRPGRWHGHRALSDALETLLVHAGAQSVDGAVVSPVFRSANFLQEGVSSYADIRYGRLSNTPNHAVLARRLAAITGAADAVVLASGMAAIAGALLSQLGQGDHLLIQRTVYGGTRTLIDQDLARFGIGHTDVDPLDPSSWEAALTPQTRVFYVESVSNPMMEVGELEAVVAFCRANGLVSVIDNTFLSPALFKPLELGFDLELHSATKYLNGHSDVVAGVVAGSAEAVRAATGVQNHFGGSLDPGAAWLLERGLKTLALRVERQCETALRLARVLADHPHVRRVRYPGLASEPGYPIASRLFAGFGGMLAFEADSAARAERFVRSVRIPLNAASLGGVESLVVRPSRSSHLAVPEEARVRAGITDALVRVSVGIENAEDLIDDMQRALA